MISSNLASSVNNGFYKWNNEHSTQMRETQRVIPSGQDNAIYYIHFEITGYPCNVIGSQRCDLFPNRTIFCSKSHRFSPPMRMAQKNKTTNQISRLFLN